MTTTETSTPPQKTKAEKAQSYLTMASTTIGIVGALGTAFVWLATTFFDGHILIVPDKDVPAVQVKVTDMKGHQNGYFQKAVYLLPGDYHVEVGVPDKQPKMHADVHVNLWQETKLPWTVPPQLVAASQDTTATDSGEEPKKKKWWQFWKHSQHDKSNPSTSTSSDAN
jgi:hypothetical protein